MPQIDKNYITSGKVKYMASDFPLPTHPHAFKAAVAAHCANEQGKFWEMSASIFENFRALGEENLPTYADQVGVEDADAFKSCLGSDRFDESIKSAVTQAKTAGIQATPSFLIGYTQPGSTKFKATDLIRGAFPYTNFQTVFDRLLREQAKEKKDGPAVQ